MSARILINALSAKQGGIATFSSNLAYSFRERGVNFRIAVSPSLSHIPNAIVFHTNRLPPARRLVWEQTVWRYYVSEWRADLLFSSANFALLSCPIPQVLLVREGGLFDPLYMDMIAPLLGKKAAIDRFFRRLLMRKSIQASDRVLVPSETFKKQIAQYSPKIGRKIEVLRYGVPIKKFEASKRRRWREDGFLKILYVSVYYVHKIPGDLVRAVEFLHAAGVPCRAYLTMDIDKIRETPGSDLDLSVIRRGMDAGLVDIGTVPYEKIPDLYAEHDIFVFSSMNETFGHPMAEAMAARIPIVAANTGVNREILGDCARYYEPFAPEKLAAEILAMDSFPLERERMAELGSKRVGRSYSWNDYVDQLLTVFSDMTGKRNR
ncbi:MAG: glycosyltransferase family 4 protein [Betaproteobacteria bacterium]|nr:glycosyltransferase family 4 protein [Betaproteobacteria bacterium]